MKHTGYFLALCAIIATPSCTRFATWTRKTFHMPDKIDVDLAPARTHLCSVRSYDQFNTVALFDVLWLSDIVKSTYAELFAVKWCKKDEVVAEIVERFLADNDEIVFYILIAEKEGIAFRHQLGKWSFTLEVDGKQYAAHSLRIIDDLPYEFRKIFGDLYNPFKTCYEMKFFAYTSQGLPIITPQTDVIRLCVSSTEYREFCVFDVVPANTRKYFPRID